MSKNINVKLSLKKIGPHSDTIMNFDGMSSINVAVYSNNGNGKTFISKSFKRVNDLATLNQENDDDVQEIIKKSNAILQMDQNNATMKFEVIDKEKGTNKQTTINFEKDKLPIITGDDSYIFHVFNNEYIKDNLERYGFHPTDNCSGYIFGKANIDLSNEKKMYEDLKTERQKYYANISESIARGKETLKNLGIMSTTKEFQNITYEEIQKRKVIAEVDDFKVIEMRYNKLTNIPDNIPDVPLMPEFQQESLTYRNIFEQIEKILTTAYHEKAFNADFRRKLKEKHEFIIEGLNLIDNNKCPFCEQEFSNSALTLIESYQAYVKGEEAKIRETIKSELITLETFGKSFQNIFKINLPSSFNEFNMTKQYFPSFDDVMLDNKSDVSLLQTACTKLEEYLKLKSDRLSETNFELLEIKKEIINFFDFASKESKRNNEKIKKLNKVKLNIANERLTIRKSLCNSKFNDLISENNILLNQYAEISLHLESLASEIKTKEEGVKKEKRAELITAFKGYLHNFFGEKYEFDENEFCIKFQGKVLLNRAEEILSDGEKGILAFCYYLANVHTIVNSEDDYSRIFFIIDDPVSSMDFHYVYGVAQCIKQLKDLLSKSFSRYILFTHNMEFFSILVRNKTVQKKYVFADGKLVPFNYAFVMPYAANLQDIYKVSMQEIKPTHTTPNSFRHIIETLYRFECCECDLPDYLNQIGNEKGNRFIYTLMQDLSHGGIREQKAYDDDSLVEACTILIEYIAEKYPGQIPYIRKLANN